MVRVILLDDCRTARLALREALGADPEVLVVGEAATGAEALALMHRLAPDLVLADVFLRRESGLDAAAAIMREVPRPIIAITGVDPRDPQVLRSAMEAGVLEVCAKLPSPRHPGYLVQRGRLLRLVRALAQVPVVHRRGVKLPPRVGLVPGRRLSQRPALLAIGASTGGPPALAELLGALPAKIGIPVAIVQHMAPGFMEGFGRWLGDGAARPVEIVHEPRLLEPDRIYLPADHRHLVVESRGRAAASDSPERGFQRPAIDELFDSACLHLGSQCLAVLMTGMGNDGAAGLARLQASGAVVLVQEPESCAVPAMPRSALARCEPDFVGTPSELAAELRRRLSAE